MRARSGGIRTSPTPNFADLADMFFETAFFFVGKDRERIKQTTMYVPTALSTDDYKLMPNLELVDGSECYVVSSGPDTLWLDPNAGFAVRRRALFRKIEPADPGVVKALYIAQNFQDYSDGVWLPEKTRRIDFADQTFPAQERGKMLGMNQFLAKWIVNNVPDSQFEIEFPAGFLIANHDNATEFFAPAGEDLLDRAISKAGRLPGVIHPGESSGARNRVSLLLIANVIAVALLVFLFALRWWRRQRLRGV